MALCRGHEHSDRHFHTISSRAYALACTDAEKTKNWGDCHFNGWSIVMFHPILVMSTERLILYSVCVVSIIRLHILLAFDSGHADPTWDGVSPAIWG